MGGPPPTPPHESVIAEAVRQLEEFGEGTAGYGLDVGMLPDGQTALVEWNDGYSLGSCGLARADYADLLIARWCELMGLAADT